MSAKQTILIVFLVVLLMAVLLGAIIINKYLKNVISSLHDDLAKLDDPLIAEDIDLLDKMDLAGASLERFSKDRKNYNRIFSEDVTKSLELLNNAAAANESYKLYTAYEIVKQVKPKVQEIGTQVLALQKGFMELLKFTRDNKLQLDALKKQYDDKRKYILSTSYDYSLALEALEDELHAIGCQFESVKNLTIQGDHVEAKRVLQKIRSAITKLEDELPLVKKTSSELLDIFPEQLTEISTTYKSMLKNKFSIVEIDICSTVKQLRNSI
ncbi:MAG: septation ring formation regulator EzrA, partial [Lactobacillus iners]|nr:septation ring formation regulator EzrA [Lactobacillus iners]